MSRYEINLEFVVNGQSVTVKADSLWQLGEAVQEALKKSGNVGQPLDNWELRDTAGNVVDMGLKLGRTDIKDGTKFFLSLKAGIGGCIVH